MEMNKENKIIENLDGVELELVYSECLNLKGDKHHRPNYFLLDLYYNLNDKKECDDLNFEMVADIFELLEAERNKRAL